jgi:UDP-N-acetylmuramoyl-L-alanyl-D-glutamate--2,6-diaminopimelate ligase
MKKIIKRLMPKFLLSFYHLTLAHLGAFIYGFPSKKMVVIGVIGTRGKTTTANYIWSILQAAGKKTGITGTANIRIGDEERMNEYHMTMPGRFVVQKLMKEMLDKDCRYAVIETPSEGIEQWRHKGIVYDVLVLTTLYPEYLAIHNWDYERLKKMDQKIFAELMRQPRKTVWGEKVPKVIVLNNDNEDVGLFEGFPADKKLTYGTKPPADLVAENIMAGSTGVSFLIGPERYVLKTLGSFNVPNALAAIAATTALGIDSDLIKKGLDSISSVPGRMEAIDANQPFSVFIDYAHDKGSMESALKAANELKPTDDSKVIVVLGAEGGGRDKKKRPVMGELAAKLADYAVVTNVDPYDDDPMEIIEDIAGAAEKAGKTRGKDLFVIEDRREGIKKAFLLAKKSDIVLVTGKGAEQSMILKDAEIPWDDREVARQELQKMVK